jgi:hypothetical protein
MVFTSKYSGYCRKCGRSYKIGDMISWDPYTKHTKHLECSEENNPLADKMAREAVLAQHIYWVVADKPFRKGTTVETSASDRKSGYPDRVVVVDHGDGEIDGKKVFWADCIDVPNKRGGQLPTNKT